MYAIIGEHNSDVNTLKVLVRRHLVQPKVKVLTKGYEGCGALLKKGANQLLAYARMGMSRFIVCHDADGTDHASVHDKVHQKIIRPCQLDNCCIVVPVQELEAWILADIEAVSNVIPSWRDPKGISNPEAVPNPKEYLERLSQQARNKPLYDHVQHNERIAEYLDLSKLSEKCPSYRVLEHFLNEDK